MRVLAFGFLLLLFWVFCSFSLQSGPSPPTLCYFLRHLRLRILIFMWESVYLAGFSVGGLLRSVNAVPMCRIYELNCLFYDCSSFDAAQSPQPVNSSTVCSSEGTNILCALQNVWNVLLIAKIPRGARCRGGKVLILAFPCLYPSPPLAKCKLTKR